MAAGAEPSWHSGGSGVHDIRVWVTARGARLNMRVQGSLDRRGLRYLAEIVAAAIRVVKVPEMVELDVRPVSVYCRESTDALMVWERQGMRVRRCR
jgi:hypothetical protein